MIMNLLATFILKEMTGYISLQEKTAVDERLIWIYNIMKKINYGEMSAIISSLIVVICYITNTVFTCIPTFGDQLICKGYFRTSILYWDYFANKAGQC